MLPCVWILSQSFHASAHCDADGADDKIEYQRKFRFQKIAISLGEFARSNVRCSDVQIEKKQGCGRFLNCQCMQCNHNAANMMVKLVLQACSVLSLWFMRMHFGIA